MNFFEKIYNFFKNIFSAPDDEHSENELSVQQLEEMANQISDITNSKEKINASRRTWLNKLYTLEQTITIFEESFPSEYETFLERIEKLRQDYTNALQSLSSELTFEINPEIDFEYSGKIVKLEKEIQKFIETEVKLDIISKRLHRLIIKLNILYNVSIFHSDSDEKEKVKSQINRAFESEKRILNELKNCYYILSDQQFKESLLNLISYTDYQIFKTTIRISHEAPDDIAKNLVSVTEFEGFNYVGAFENFIKEEISDLSELLPMIGDEYRKIFSKKFKRFLADLTYSEPKESKIFDFAFWESFFENESSLIQMLQSNGVDKDTAKVKHIKKMNISVDESDVIVFPKTNAYLSLTTLFAKTNDKKILLLLKTLKNISKEVTYKEIYFLLQLFDVDELIMNEPNELFKHVEQYFSKYPYTDTAINLKKEQVKNSYSKEYFMVFTLNEYEDDIITVLEDLSMDFQVTGNMVFMNSFYFNGLENVFDSLQTNTQNIY